MSAYDAYLAGRLEDLELPGVRIEQAVQEPPTAPVAWGRAGW
jgi:hypothetical protein